MNAYDSIMAAADHIESHPDDFRFVETQIPTGHCGSPGCALGWIGHFSRSAIVQSFSDVAEAVLKLQRIPGDCGDGGFYDRMDKLCRGRDYLERTKWRASATICAQTLRAYAAKYHAPALRTDSELVSALMESIGKQTIPDGEIASPEYARA